MFKEFKLNEKVTLRNKIVIAPMTTWSANDDLTVGDEELKYYEERSTGAGMVITGCTFFQKNGQGFDNQFYAGSDEYIESLKKLADSIKKGGAKAILQIFHGGRMADPRKGGLVSASAIKATHSYAGPVEDIGTPKALTHKEILIFIDDFYKTTIRAIKAGFDGIEIHGANTYLLQQFFSPHSNRREDEWGGSLEKRMKLPLEIIKAANKAKDELKKDEFIIGYRFSPEELEEPGIKLDDTLYFIDKLANEKIDYLHASIKDYSAKSIRDEKVFLGETLANKIDGRKALIGVGNIHTKEDAEDALNNYSYDLIAIGHVAVTEAKWVEKVKKGEDVEEAIDFNNYEAQFIPKNLAGVIQSMPGWFKVK